MKHTLYDVKNGVDVIAIVGEEVRRTVLDAGTLADLRENINFENHYMKVWDRFLDGHNFYADGKEYMEYKCDGYTVRFERDATIINREKLFEAIKAEVLNCLKYRQRKLYKIDDDGDLIESDEHVQLVINCRNFNYSDYDIEAVNGFTSENPDEIKDEVIKEFFENDDVTDDDINSAIDEIIKDGESMLIFE